MKKNFNKIFIFSFVFLLEIINVSAGFSCSGIKVSEAGLRPKIADSVQYVCKDYDEKKHSYSIVSTGEKRLAGFSSGKEAFAACQALPDVGKYDTEGNTKEQMSHAPYRNSWLDDLAGSNTEKGCAKENVSGKATCTYPTKKPSKTCPGSCKEREKNEDGTPGDCIDWYPDYPCCSGVGGSLCYDDDYCCSTASWSTRYESTIEFDTTVATKDCNSASKTNQDGNCYDCEVSAWIDYDSYDKKCTNSVLDVVDANSWSYAVTGDDVHCVNPGKQFGQSGEDGTNYLWDSSFDITRCKSSLTALDADGNIIDEENLTGTANQNSRKVCGFANILVMGKYLNYSEEVINGAIRLFSYHTDDRYNFISSSGFKDITGNALPMYKANIVTYVGPVNVNKPKNFGSRDCDWCVRFFADNHGWDENKTEYNQYINTYNFLRYGSITEGTSDGDNWFKGGYLAKVDGDISKVKSVDDLKGFGCQIDTAHMGMWCTAQKNGSEEYLKSLYLLINTIQGNDRLQYYIKELTGNEVAQYEPSYVRTAISKEVVNGKGELTITAEMKDKVEVECDVNDPDTREFCKVEKIFVSVGNNEVELGKFPNYYDYCKKNYCYKTVKYYMNVCTNTIEGTRPSGEAYVAIVTEKSKAQAAVKKLVPCSNAANSQNMYALDLDSSIKNSGTVAYKTVDNITYDLDDFSVVETTQTIQLCNCEDNTCRTSNKKYLLITTPDGQTYTDVNQAKGKNNCAGYNKFREGNYNSYAYSKVEDPTMNCIINMCYSADKAKYDYSGYYGVNTDVCRIYCRDEVHMFMADKTTAYAGMQFKYDIAGKVFIGRPRSDEVHALTTIVIELRQCISDIYFNKPNDDGNTWQDLIKLANDKHKNKTEVAQLVIDLENCNLLENGHYAEYSAINKNIHYPIYNKKNLSSSDNSSTYKLIHDLYKYDNPDSELNSTCNGSGCVTATVEYENTIELIDALKGKEEALSISTVNYCSGSDCLKYSGKGDTTKANLIGTYQKESISKFISNAFVLGNNVDVPSNDYAQIKIKYEANLYNPKLYEVDPYTGKYNEVTGTAGRIQIDPYSYPVSLEAQTNVYPIKYQFDIKTFYRNTTNQDGFEKVLTQDGALARYTCGYDVYNNTVKYPTKCYYVSNGIPDILKRTDCPDDTPNGIRYGFVYRNIDLANVFPNARGYETNWSTEIGKETVKSVEKSASDLQTTTKYLQYSYTLDPEAIKSIRNDYNSLHDGVGYINNTLKNCQIVDTPSGKASYRNCKSDFIEEIANPTNKYGIIVNKGDGVKTGGSN